MIARNNAVLLFILFLAVFFLGYSINDKTIDPGGGFGAKVDNTELPGLRDTTSAATEGIFAKLVVGRNITYMGVGNPYKIDFYEAVFDSNYALLDPIRPIGTINVTCNDNDLVWNKYAGIHTYPELPMPMSSIIAPGTVYTFQVSSGEGIPPLTRSIAFPSLEPYLTYPNMTTILDRSGFDITWAGAGRGVVELTFMDSDGQIVLSEETSNNGSYAISPELLSQLPSGECILLMNYHNRETIAATGYDSRSYIAARVRSQTMFTLR